MINDGIIEKISKIYTNSVFLWNINLSVIIEMKANLVILRRI